MPTKTEKRPVHSFTAEERLKAVLRVHAGESKASVARDIGVAVSTFRGWCKNEKNINFDKRGRSSRKWTEATKLEVPLMLNSRSSSATFTNSSTGHCKEDIQPGINFALANKENLIKLRRLGVEMGLDVPEIIPSEQDRVKIMEILRRNHCIMETFKFLLYQYHQNLSIVRNTIASSANTFVTTPEGTITISDEYRAPPEETQTSNQKVWDWLLNHHHGAYEPDET